MPLPPNSTISLQGHSRPGEGTTTVPKIAMVIRMTEETLDALQGLSGTDRMDFKFGDKPGIFVRDQFFPMRYDKAKDNQELFIRTTTSTRPNPPLKLNANVVGKFAVENVLSNKITQLVHNATAAAAKQKAEHKAIMLDVPPVMPTTAPKAASATKKKGPPKGTSKSTHTLVNVKSYVAAPSQQVPAASSSTASTLPKEQATMYHQRLIHYLALGPATEQDIFKGLGGTDIDYDTRAGIRDILKEVAEQEQVPRKAASTSQAPKWQLKPRTWLEVRPYQYSGYTDNVRTRVARSARNWLGSLRIPESNPAWDHVKFRDSGHSASSSGTNAVQRPTNGTTTAAAKKAKIKRDAETKPTSDSVPLARQRPTTSNTPQKTGNPPLGRESTPIRATKGTGRETDTEKEEGELSASQTPPRVPASKDTRLPGSRPSGASTPVMQPPVSPRTLASSQASSASSKQAGPMDARGPKRPPAENVERARAAPPMPPPASIDRRTATQAKGDGAQVKKESASLARGGNGLSPLADSSQPVKGRDLARRGKERESDKESLRKSRRETDRESDRESIRGHDRGQVPKVRDLARARDREQAPHRETLKTKEQPPSRLAKPTSKRKPAESSDEESSDWGYEDRKHIRKSTLSSSNPSTSKVKRESDTLSSKNSVSSLKAPTRETPPPKQKMKRELSPPAINKVKPALDRRVTTGTSSVVPSVSKKNAKVDGISRLTNGKSLKRPRSSIDYTSSSEDEEEALAPKSSKLAAKATVPSSQLPVKNSETRSRPSKPPPPRSKREQLREQYSTVYNEYIIVFQKLVAEKKKFDRILRYGSESPSELSDADFELGNLEQVEGLKADYQRLHDRLEDIKRAYEA